MSEKYFASFYKCALQVNPYCYAEYRGENPMSEEDYNAAILEKCRENHIDVVGLANHGNVDDSEKLRKKLGDNGVVVFPGFEIMSAEKIHMVCLFPETCTASELNRYLGSMGLGMAINGNETSTKTCLDIADMVEKAGGFWYAAHITGDNGILKLGKLNTVWQSEKLVAAQIPDSKENVDSNYKNIISNKDPQYKREKLPAYINACDIDKPEDLDKESATTLIKMSELTFANFVIAFKDPDSRIRLNSELEKGYQSSICALNVFGGYLDGLTIEFSDNLNAVIGGRGTGKSTIINLIRYALDLLPKDKIRRKEFDEMLENNLGTSARVELSIRSNSRFGESFKVIRRYKANPTIEDMNGKVSNLSVKDILPGIEIYGQNEIMDVVRSPEQITQIVRRLFQKETTLEQKIEETYTALQKNSKELDTLEEQSASEEQETADLPALKERLEYYKSAGLDGKLSLITQLTNEKSEFEAVSRKLPRQIQKLSEVNFPVDGQLKNTVLVDFITAYNKRIEEINKLQEDLLSWSTDQFNQIRSAWESTLNEKDDEIRNSLSMISGIQDKTGAEIVEDYTALLKKINGAEPIQHQIEQRKKEVARLKQERKTLVEACQKCWDEYAASVNKQLKKLNKKKLNGVVEIDVRYRQQKDSLLQRLKAIDGVGEKAVTGIDQYDGLDVFVFAEDVRSGADTIKSKYSLTAGMAEKIVQGLTEKDLREIEEMRLEDLFVIKLFVNGRFKEMGNLSKGQQCTAILHILLLENKDSLIVDQPEDNLDNSFITDTLVTAIRDNKIHRQYIFATHNANIPVFGDAELIVAMDETEGHGHICEGGIGSVDSQMVKEHVVRILEGGEAAFKMREEKYGL